MILTTAGIAASRHVRVFPAEHILLDEASRIKEYESVNETARFHTAQKISYFGDQNQLPPTYLEVSEWEFTDIIFFERLISVWHRVHLLRRQYRIHPSISRFISEAF